MSPCEIQGDRGRHNRVASVLPLVASDLCSGWGGTGPVIPTWLILEILRVICSHLFFICPKSWDGMAFGHREYDV